MERNADVLAASTSEDSNPTVASSDAVADFLKSNMISDAVANLLRELPEEQQKAVISTPLSGAQKPSAVLLSRSLGRIWIRGYPCNNKYYPTSAHLQGIDRTKSAQPELSDQDIFLQGGPFDADACRSFLELSVDQQRQLMKEDFSQCRNPSAYLMSRVRNLKDSKEARQHDRRWSALPPQPPPPPHLPQPPQPPPPPSANTDILETFLRRHGIDAGGREALHQLPAELQLAVLAHDHEIGQGGRNPSQHLVSLVGMAWAGTLKPPQADPYEAFLDQHGIDSSARQAFQELPIHLRQLVIEEGPIVHCWNPSAVLFSRIGRVRPRRESSTDASNAARMRSSLNFSKQSPQPLPNSLQSVPQPPFPSHKRPSFSPFSTQRLIQAAQSPGPPICHVPPIVSPLPAALPLTDGSTASSSIPRAFQRLVAGQSDSTQQVSKKRKAEDLEEDGELDLAADQFSSFLTFSEVSFAKIVSFFGVWCTSLGFRQIAAKVEGFLRLNGIDGKSCRAMRRLPRSARRMLIGMDLRQRRNPSAFLWMQIQKLRDDGEGSDGLPPPPPASAAKLPSPPMPPAPPPPVKAAPWHQVKLEEFHSARPSTLKQDPAQSSGSVAFVLFRHGGGTSVPEFVEVLDHLHVLTCGRACSSDILLKVQHASKKHAEFRVEHGPSGEAQLMFCDVSSNGTWLNGDKLPNGRWTRLVSGDVVLFLPPGSSEDVPALQVEDQQAKSQARS